MTLMKAGRKSKYKGASGGLAGMEPAVIWLGAQETIHGYPHILPVILLKMMDVVCASQKWRKISKIFLKIKF